MIHSLIHLAGTATYDFTYLFIFLGIALVSYMIQANLKSKFEKFSKIPIGMTGRDVAIKMLHDNGIYDVKVTSTFYTSDSESDLRVEVEGRSAARVYHYMEKIIKRAPIIGKQENN